MIGVLYGTGIQGSDNKGYVRIERETFPDVPNLHRIPAVWFKTVASNSPRHANAPNEHRQPRRALAAISPIVDSSEPGYSQNADKHLEWLGHAYRFALGRWIGAIGWDIRGSRVPRRYLVYVPWASLCLAPQRAIAQRFCAALPHRGQ